jgi:RNA polymerase sigma factor (sigma-70 family)
VPSAVVGRSGGTPLFGGIGRADPERLAPTAAGSRPHCRVEKTSGGQTTSRIGSRSGSSNFVEPFNQDDSIARYEALFRMHHAFILNLCLKRLQDASDAEDAVQETFLRALSHPRVLEEPIPWLIRVATHLCIDQLRRRRRAELALKALKARTSHCFENEDSERPGASVDVDDLLAILTEAERRVITLTLLWDKAHGDVATGLGITSSTSRVLRSRALKKLRVAVSAGAPR